MDAIDSFRYRRRVFLPPGSEEKIIVYAWVNDGKTRRKGGDKNDPYVLFKIGLKNGKPASGLDALVAESKALESRWAFEE